MRLRQLILLALGGTAAATAPPGDSLQSYCHYCGKSQREPDSDCTNVDCLLTFGQVTDMVVQLKNTSHHVVSTSTLTVSTRGYNPDSHMPLGPTIKVKPGDTLKVTLVNDLVEDDEQAARMDGLTNFQHDYQATNLHTHGLHISGEDPADNVFRRVAPQGRHTYRYDIPRDHMPGTHWYHPHFHGPTGIQAGGGAVGMLIVEDIKDQLPAYLENVEEKHLVILGLNANNQQGIESDELRCCLAYGNKSKPDAEIFPVPPSFGGPCAAPASSAVKAFDHTSRSNHLAAIDQTCKEQNGEDCSSDQLAYLVHLHCNNAAIWNTDGAMPTHTMPADAVISSDKAIFLVNGEYVPDVVFKAGVWTRVRVLFASITDQMYLMFPAFCQASLLAKDGVYLHEAPRPVEYAFFGLGNRADFLVKCTETPDGEPHLLDALLYNQNDDQISNDDTTDVLCKAAEALKPKVAELTDEEIRSELLGEDSAARNTLSIPLMNVHVTPADDEATTCQVPKFRVARPCYLADLQSAGALVTTLDASGKFLQLEFGPPVNFTALPPEDKTRNHNSVPFTINGKRYNEEGAPMFVEQVGSLVQFNITHVFNHAFHWHVIPFQLQTSYNDFEDLYKRLGRTNILGEPYFQAGDWHDTLQVPPKWCDRKFKSDKEAANSLTFTVRANVDKFISRQVVHCHVLDHEDWGMMTILNFTENSDGNLTYWGNKIHLDPTCYQGKDPANKAPRLDLQPENTCCAGPEDSAGCGGGECRCQDDFEAGARDLLFSSHPVPPVPCSRYACA